MTMKIYVLLCFCHSILCGELIDKKHQIRGRDYGSSYDPPFNDVPLGYIYPIPNPPSQFDDPPNLPGGLYDPPIHRPTPPPILQDEPPQIFPTYLPPPVYPPLGQPPQFDPIPTDDTIVIPSPPNDQYLPSIPFPPPATYGVSNLNANPVQVRVFNMSCFDATTKRFFRSVLRTSQFIGAPPVVDNGRNDCVLGGAGDLFRLDLEGNKMTQCGVRYCSGSEHLNLCVSLRIPTVRGLRLPEDTLLTLQCRPQERVATHVKNLRLLPQNIQGRSSASTIASGGLQRNFDTQMSLFRRAPGTNEYSQIVNQGSAVQLGEELLLRAAVRDGDGWKFSRMGAVTMNKIASTRASSSSRAAQDSVTLVDNLGCRIPSMRSVCPEQPRQVNPLVTTFPFRAFMFQGANSGDEMVLSVRMVGCIQNEDCVLPRSCEEKVHARTRVKRKSQTETRQENVTNWQSYLEFKVVLPSGYTNPEDTQTHPERSTANPVIIMFGSLTTIFLVVLCVLAIFRQK